MQDETATEKIWVILSDDVLSCYDSPFEIGLRCTIPCRNIGGVEEEREAFPGGAVGRFTLKMTDGSEYKWSWSDETAKLKGLWMNQVCRAERAQRR